MKKTLIKCDKCGSTSVTDKKLETVEVETLSIDEYIKRNQSKTLLNYRSGDWEGQCIISAGVSHMEKRILECHDCGYTRLYDQVIYT